jgi:hypothetical protein
MTFEQRLHDLFGDPNDSTVHALPERIDEIEKEALAELGRIADDKRFTPQHKIDATADVQAAATRYIDAILAAVEGNLDDTRARLQRQARVVHTPSAESAPQLNYLKDSLDELWSLQSTPEFLAGWRDALDTGDLLELRIYRDFGLGQLLARPPYSELDVATVIRQKPAQDLIAATERALMTEEQQAAADRLDQLDQDVFLARRAGSGAKYRIQKAQIGQDGSVTDGQRAAARDIAKSI